MAGRWRIVSAAAVVAAALAGAEPAHAVVPACGSTIMVDTTLPADLSCAGDGLTIGAPNVVLDLGGHTIGGNGAAFGVGGSGTGVRLLPTASGSTVRNGRIRGFRVGLHVPAGAEGTDVVGSELVDNAMGAVLASGGNRVRSNLMRTNGAAMNLSGHGNQVVGNAVHANAAGIAGTGSSLYVVGNSIVGDGAHDAGVLLVSAHGATVSGNSVSRSREGAGILIVSGMGIDVTANQVFDNRDGIVSGSGTRLASNVVFANVELGIRGQGATDGGGNRGFANGNPLQCIGVACS